MQYTVTEGSSSDTAYTLVSQAITYTRGYLEIAMLGTGEGNF